MIAYKKELGYPVDLEFKSKEMGNSILTEVFVNGNRIEKLFLDKNKYGELIRKYAQGFFDALEWEKKEIKQ